MRVVFLGTPLFAVPSLEALLSAHEVVAVFTQPDRPKGRGGVLALPPVKQAALAAGLAVHQPERIRRPPNPELLRELAPELMVVVGYGQIIPQAIIDISRHGILNVHASLLPKYRGAAPVQWAVANGETETGVTIMQIDAGLDTGDMLLQRPLAIGPDESAAALSLRLAESGATLLLEAIRQIESGTIRPEKQDEAAATLAPILKKEDGLILWSRTAQEIYNRLRGFMPWPGAYTSLRGQPLQITAAQPVPGESAAAPGTLTKAGGRLLATCGSRTALEIVEVQPAGKKRMSAQAFINGYRLGESEALGDAA